MSTESDKLLRIIREKLIQRITDSTILESVISDFRDLSLHQDRPEYADLTLLIYESDDDEIFEILGYNLQDIKQRIYETTDQSLKNYIGRLDDHIRLAKQQKDYINKTLKLAQERLNEINKRADEAEDKLKDIQEIKSKIYTEFVTILGIFTAVVLGAFGSLQVIGSVFNHIKEVPTGKLLVFSSLTSMGVILLLFILMRWINRIVHVNSGDRREWKVVAKENSIFLLGFVVLVYMNLIGFMLYGKEPKQTVYLILGKWYFGIGGLIISSVIAIGLIFWIVKITYFIGGEND